MIPTCRQCSKPLKPTQGVYCSPGCHAGGVRALPDRDCAGCGLGLTRRQLRSRAVCCSTICSRAVTVLPTPIQDAILAVLRGNTHTWMTVSDLAIWVHGYDDQAECAAIRNMVYRLRGMGYAIADRRATWVMVMGCARAYRLISEPSSAPMRRVA